MNWMNYRKIYFAISATLIAIGTYSMLTWGLHLGIDFLGGSNLEIKPRSQISTEDISTKITNIQDVEVSSIQKTSNETFIIKTNDITLQQKDEILTLINQDLENPVEELRFEKVGPSIGQDLVKKTYYAIAAASISILLWVAYQFKNIRFGVSAILAMFHDTFILIGSFALFGHLYGAETDFLFVTAVLTTLSFSVHDTIVVFDRIRERQKETDNTIFLANRAISETMVRSLNNSFTILFMLAALILLGGTTIQWFAVALFVGTLAGTYSSPFVAVSLLVTWQEVADKIKK